MALYSPYRDTPLYVRARLFFREPQFFSALSENREAFKRIFLVPRMMRDVSDIDLSVELFGQRLSMPVFVSPAGERKHSRGK